MKKSEHGETDFLSLLIVALIVIGLICGIGPCRNCFYKPGQKAPHQLGQE